MHEATGLTDRGRSVMLDRRALCDRSLNQRPNGRATTAGPQRQNEAADRGHEAMARKRAHAHPEPRRPGDKIRYALARWDELSRFLNEGASISTPIPSNARSERSRSVARTICSSDRT